MQAQGMVISDLQRVLMGMTDDLNLIQSNKKWSEIRDLMQRAVWLQNQCGMMIPIGEKIARQILEQVGENAVFNIQSTTS